MESNAEGRMKNAEVRSGGDLKKFAPIGVIRVKAQFPSFASVQSSQSSVSLCVHPWLKTKADGRIKNAEVRTGGGLKAFAPISVIRVKAPFPPVQMYQSSASICVHLRLKKERH